MYPNQIQIHPNPNHNHPEPIDLESSLGHLELLSIKRTPTNYLINVVLTEIAINSSL